MRSLSSFLSLVLIPLIAVLPIRAQLPPAPAAAEATLQVRVVESSVNQFMVEITDGSAAPVDGAAVAFRLPDSDPIGTFADGSHASVVYTDINGRARVSGIQWNRTSGVATVRITAVKGASHAGLILEQAISSTVVDVPVAKLSGGQRQAIAVARSVYQQAKVLLLDEPTAAMGVKESALILDVIQRLKQEGEVGVIIIAHNYAQIFDVCDRVNLIEGGRITFDKPTAETSIQELTDIVVKEYRNARRDLTA